MENPNEMEDQSRRKDQEYSAIPLTYEPSSSVWRG